MNRKILFLSICSLLLFVNPAYATPIMVDFIVDLNPSISQIDNKEFASISYIEYDIVRPGEMFLGSDRKPGTSDDILYDPWWADPYTYAWEITLLYASSNIAPDFELGHTYDGLGNYDGGGISDWIIPGLLSFSSIDAGKGTVGIGNLIYFGGYGNNEAVVVSSSITPYYAPIPEPASMLLFGTGLVGLVGSCLRRKEK